MLVGRSDIEVKYFWPLINNSLQNFRKVSTIVV